VQLNPLPQAPHTDSIVPSDVLYEIKVEDTVSESFSADEECKEENSKISASS
jgi:hypothetical protein